MVSRVGEGVELVVKECVVGDVGGRDGKRRHRRRQWDATGRRK